MKPKIINILQHPPAYEMYSNGLKPEINWNTPDGQWVGIAGYDWPNQLGNEVLKLTNEFDYEVWQPDLRADKIYSHTFDNGLMHRLFPANKKNVRFGLRIISRFSSKQLLSSLKNEKPGYTILHLNNPMHHLNLAIMQD